MRSTACLILAGVSVAFMFATPWAALGAVFFFLMALALAEVERRREMDEDRDQARRIIERWEREQ